MTDGLRVTGGTGGVDAKLDDMEAASRIVRREASELASYALSLQTLLTNGDLAASAVLDPGGAARCEAALAAAVDGPHGVVALAAEIEFLGLELWGAAAAYRATDEAIANAIVIRHWATGFVIGAGAIPLAAVGGASYLDDQAHGGHVTSAVEKYNWDKWIANHPGVVDEASADLPGIVSGIDAEFFPITVPFALVDGKNPFPLTMQQGAGLVGTMYPDGHGSASYAYATPASAPTSLTDILQGLALRNTNTTGATSNQIDVRVITTRGADGVLHTSYIVDIPGTKDWAPNPFSGDRSSTPNDLGTNIHGLAGDDTARQEAVLQALRDAGAQPTDPVLLVGHSQGGLVAMSAANSVAKSGQFTITHVITAGSPVAGAHVPPGTKVLSLENSVDVVPLLDGKSNQDDSNHVTVVFTNQSDSVSGNHDMTKTYAAEGPALQASANASVKAYVNGLGAFTTGAVSSSTRIYDVTRTQ